MGPFSLFMLCQSWSFLHSNDDFGGALLSAFGTGYWLQFAASAALPMLSLIALAIYDFGRLRRVRRNNVSTDGQ